MANKLAYKPFYRRFLPHIQPPGAAVFVTSRLAGTLPAHIIAALSTQLEANLKAAETRAAETDMLPEEFDRVCYRLHKQAFGRYDALLDQATHGPTWLKQTAIAELVAAAIHHRDRGVYDLHSFTIMPNHVHLVFTPRQDKDGVYVSLARIMHSLKLYTASQANKVLGREGAFWQIESYDTTSGTPNTDASSPTC